MNSPCISVIKSGVAAYQTGMAFRQGKILWQSDENTCLFLPVPDPYIAGWQFFRVQYDMFDLFPFPCIDNMDKSFPVLNYGRIGIFTWILLKNY
jgi:hypothetical protein